MPVLPAANMNFKLLFACEADTSTRPFSAVLKVTVVCFGGMRQYLPLEAKGNEARIDIPEHADVVAAIRALGAPMQHVFAVLVDGEQSTLQTPLYEGAQVVLMPPFSGGARGAAVVTISDGVAAGKREDRSGEAVSRILEDSGYSVSERVVIPDEEHEIEAELRRLVELDIPLVCTTGGTGLSVRDVTPEATKRVVERPAPGIEQLIRQAGLTETKRAALSRGVAGTARSTLIINLPGSPRGADTSLRALIDILEHALDLIAGDTHHDEHLRHQ